jgi:BMFP domain-containing protein YqiC
MVFEYVIMLPASVAFSNIQSYKHENPMKDDMNRILEKLDNMEKRMDKLDNMEQILISSIDDLETLEKRLEPLEKRLVSNDDEIS